MDIYAKMKRIASREIDPSYPSPERQLLFRLEDLIDRYNEIIRAMDLSSNNDYEDDYICYEELICFSPPEEMKSIYLIEKAIKRAKMDLREIYGIDPDFEPEGIEEVCEKERGNASFNPCVVEQLLIFDCDAFCTIARK